MIPFEIVKSSKVFLLCVQKEIEMLSTEFSFLFF